MTKEMAGILQFTEMALNGGRVKRFHTLPVIGHETVAEHSFGVVALVLAITYNRASSNLIKAAMFHDLAEQETGDNPAPAKWNHPVLKAAIEAAEEKFNEKWKLDIKLDDRDENVLKWADMLHLLFFCKHQRELGNKHMDKVFRKGVRYLQELGDKTDDFNGTKILNWLIDQYEL